MELLYGPILSSQTLAGTELESIIRSLGQNLVPALLFTVLGIVGVITIIFGTINSTAKKKESEKSKKLVKHSRNPQTQVVPVPTPISKPLWRSRTRTRR